MFATPAQDRAILSSDFEIPATSDAKYTLYVTGQGGDVAHSRVLPGQPLRFIVPKDIQVQSAEVVSQTCVAPGGEQ